MQLNLDLQTFEYNHQQRVRTVMVNGDPWFCLADLCGVLGLSRAEAYDALDNDEVSTTSVRDGSYGERIAEIVSEPGMYSLILRSQTEDAKVFKRWIKKEVLPQIRRTGSYAARGNGTPLFVRRYNDNWNRVSPGYFSVISELLIRVYGRFEQVGHILPDRALSGAELRPDVSVGIHFSKWLKKYDPVSVSRRRTYSHLLPDGKEVEAYEYPHELWPTFIAFVDNYWLPKCAPEYLGKRDPAALSYIPKVLPANSASKTLVK